MFVCSFLLLLVAVGGVVASVPGLERVRERELDLGDPVAPVRERHGHTAGTRGALDQVADGMRTVLLEVDHDVDLAVAHVFGRGLSWGRGVW